MSAPIKRMDTNDFMGLEWQGVIKLIVKVLNILIDRVNELYDNRK